jgi:hypothetical protein
MIFILSIVILLVYCTSNETSVNIIIYYMVNFPSNYQILLFYSFVKPLLDFDYYNFPSLHVIEISKKILSKLSYLELLQIHMDLNPYPHQHWKKFHASLLIFMVNNSFPKLLPLINTSLWKCFFFYKSLPSYIYIWHVFKLLFVHKDGISHLENISRIILLSHLFVFFKFHLVWCSMLPLVLDL